MIGTHDIVISQMNSQGVIKPKENVDLPGRIIRFQDDENYNNGMLILTDGSDGKIDPSVRHREYNEVNGSNLFTFPAQESKGKLVTLNALK